MLQKYVWGYISGDRQYNSSLQNIFPTKNVANGDRPKNFLQKMLQIIPRYKIFPRKNVANGDRPKYFL